MMKKLFRSKKADSEQMFREIVGLIIIIIFAAILTVFIHVQSEGSAMKEQRLVKKIALLIDASEPGMTIRISTAGILKIDMDKEKKEIFVQAKEDSKGKRYPYFTRNNLEFKFYENGVFEIAVT
jgi:hypothetical protein